MVAEHEKFAVVGRYGICLYKLREIKESVATVYIVYCILIFSCVVYLMISVQLSIQSYWLIFYIMTCVISVLLQSIIGLYLCIMVFLTNVRKCPTSLSCMLKLIDCGSHNDVKNICGKFLSSNLLIKGIVHARIHFSLKRYKGLNRE